MRMRLKISVSNKLMSINSEPAFHSACEIGSFGNNRRIFS